MTAAEVFSQRLYRGLSDDDRRAHSTAAWTHEAEDMLAWGAVRAPEETLVRAINPGHCSHSVLQIVTTDRPFLLDSVMAELSRAGHSVTLVLHPQLAVVRDAEGALVDIIDVDVDDIPSDSTAQAESWMRIEFPRDYLAEDLQNLESRTTTVINAVARVVSDWPQMRDRARALSRELENPPPGVAVDQSREAAALLDWLADDHFTFLGYRSYDLVEIDGVDALRPVSGSGLGILSWDDDTDDAVSLSFAVLPPAVRAKAREPHVLVLTKANSRSPVHRAVYMDYVGIKRFDDQGLVIGEDRFLGLYASSAYTQSVTTIPVLRQLYTHTVEALDLVPQSHDAKDLTQFLETYPRDELFQISQQDMVRIASGFLQMQERRLTRVFSRQDTYGRFVSVLVYLPRDRYTTSSRQAIEEILREAYAPLSIDYTVRVTESVLARLHFVVRIPQGEVLSEVDEGVIQERIAEATRSWSDDYQSDLVAKVGEERSRGLLAEYARAFPPAYQQDFDAYQAVLDTLKMEELLPDQVVVDLSAPVVTDARELRFRIMRRGAPISLSVVLPILQRLGVDVIDEYPYEISRATQDTVWILDFGLILPASGVVYNDSLFTRFEEAFLAGWHGQCGIDSFNSLVVTGGLTWQDVALLRAYARYMRQTGSTFGQGYLEEQVLAHAPIVRVLGQLFTVRFDPDFVGNREEEEAALTASIEGMLEDVSSLDADRVLRQLLSLIKATVRTNYYQDDDREAIAFKFDPRRIPDLPLPVPAKEMWVYSTRVEGVHLRFGDVARGGLRWSDRREDFRTEILGLVKAQEVKNAVIVPVGAKGGFYAKKLPDPSVDREAWLAEGTSAYREFIAAMLSITDNLVDGQVVVPPRVVRHDGDDPYLVVAADKGTATFSDIANAIANEFGFWLGDAFASGGSVGYDHKAMGITARGAWESVKRHFRELGINTQTQPFTVVGIGDMSGDVFGNGMLLSEQIRLVAAFDHRHIFIDPNPAATAFAERSRLFAQPRSSWADYNPELISEGGGVFPRTAKSVEISTPMREALGLDITVERLTPDQLISAILRAPVDLLWNGGIGTYVRAQNESNADVGDKSNDSIRIPAHQLRVKVIGEGGNLGLTQRGRIEAARHGVKLNTDAIDNSAGVDTSDHEVNIKILLDAVMKSGELTYEERNALLADMTDDIATMVLQDNYDQNVVLGNARRGGPALITVHQRMIKEMERRQLLDRSLEALPDDEEFATLIHAASALTSPELSVLLAYAKIWLTKNLAKSTLSEDPWFTTALHDYFPSAVREKYADAIDAHPLKARIIDTVITNRLLNVGGITFVYRAIEETGASVVQVVRAATASMEIFGIRDLWNWINSLDNQIPTSAQSALQLEVRRLLDRATRWFLQFRGGELDISAEVAAFRSSVAEHAHQVPEMLMGTEAARLQRRIQRFVEAGAPQDLAREAAAALDVFALLDITDICKRTGEPATAVIPLYFALSERYGVDRTLICITDLPRDDRWSALARQALRSDLYQAIAALTTGVMRASDPAVPSLTRIEQWEAQHSEGVERAHTTLEEIAAVENPDLATLSVSLRVLRNLVAQGS